MISEKVKQVIDDAIRLNGKGNIKTIVFPDGRVSTNYIPFLRYFSCCGQWTKDMSDYVKSTLKGK